MIKALIRIAFPPAPPQVTGKCLPVAPRYPYQWLTVTIPFGDHYCQPPPKAL